MLDAALEQIRHMPGERLLWSTVAALMIGQLLAIYLLCSSQVSQARVRDASLQRRQLAIAQCLQTVPKATRSSCSRGLAPLGDDELVAR